jgi:hypothetical protein
VVGFRPSHFQFFLVSAGSEFVTSSTAGEFHLDWLVVRSILAETRVAAQSDGFRKEAEQTPGAELLVMNKVMGHELPQELRKSNAGTVAESSL